MLAQLPGLQKLGMGGTGLGDAGLAQLAGAVASHQAMRVVGLSGETSQDECQFFSCLFPGLLSGRGRMKLHSILPESVCCGIVTLLGTLMPFHHRLYPRRKRRLQGGGARIHLCARGLQRRERCSGRKRLYATRCGGAAGGM